MNYEKLESDVLARLQPLQAAGFVIELLPEVQSTESRPPAGKARATVGYKMSEFDDPNSTSHITQVETAHVEVIFECQKLRGVGNLYDLQRRVHALLLGFEPSDWSKLQGKIFSIIDRKDGFWMYSVTYTCTAISVETVTDDAVVLTTQITVGDTTVP